MATDKNLYKIESLDVNIYGYFHFYGRIVAVQELRTFPSPVQRGVSPAKRRCLPTMGKLLSFDVEDETGILHILLWGNMVEKWQNVIVVGNLLHIEDGLLEASKYAGTLGRIELNIKGYSKLTVMRANSDFHGAPFQPIQLATVAAREIGTEVNVLAVIKHLGEIKNHRVEATGEPFATLEITMLDDSTKDAFGVEYQLATDRSVCEAIQVGDIISIRRAIVKQFQEYPRKLGSIKGSTVVSIENEQDIRDHTATVSELRVIYENFLKRE